VRLRATDRETVLAFMLFLGVTAALLAVRGALDKTHVALAYLLTVLAVSSRGGRAPGVAVSVAGFLSFNFFFVRPYHTFTVAEPLDWAVLVAFLLTSLVAAQLLVRARNEAASAQLRAAEVERLSALGAETLNAGRTDDALHAIIEVIRRTLGAALCDVYIREEGEAAALLVRTGASAPRDGTRAFGQPSAERIVEWVAVNGRVAVELNDGSMRVGQADRLDLANLDLENLRVLVLPLHVRERTVGVLTITPEGALNLDAPSRRFLEALSYYAALGVERLRLARDADRAQALEKADEAKNAVLASVSHDLRTPLTTIKALANEIRQEGDERAAIIEEEADRLNRFVADLLDLSRLMGGGFRVEAEINAAEDLVGAAMQRVSGAAGDRNVVASLDPSETLLLGRFDFVHSLRVLGNLIENAVKFAPPHSDVEVQARRAQGSLEFLVSDRGPGIPPSDRESVFQPFYRAGDGPDAGGVGLGLSIARGLAAAQGGSLRYEPREGGGSRFIFSVPAADASELAGLTGVLEESL
jgi:two-component system sensor histidine kinase KdpD